ncbi:MAG: hypothetical protein AB9900_02320 [Humidesulfovibrio sp.]
MSVPPSTAPRPFPAYRPALAFILAFTLTLALAEAALAEAVLSTTSETCLRRCLTSCSEQGRPGDEACLRPCLKDCPVHCGTVDTDRALECVRDAAPGPDSNPRTLAARCAETCVVKAVCRPSAYDSGPAELRAPSSIQAPAPHLKAAEKRLEPRGRSFSLVAPQGWTLHEQDGDHELVFLARGAAMLDYAQISVRHVPGPHRTAARFRFDLEHPSHAPANATAPVMAPVMTRSDLSGAEAWRVETRSVRSLIGLGDSVPILKRTLLLPQDVGYFVLALETPEATAEANAKVFERLAGSFRCQLKAGARGPELSVRERAVWTGFFSSGGKVELAGSTGKGAGKGAGKGPDEGAPPEIDPNFGQPQQYLRDTARARLVGGRTLAAPALDAGVLAGLLRGCGIRTPDTPDTPDDPDLAAQAQALNQAWEAVRGQQVLVTDEFFLPGRGAYGLRVQEGSGSDRGGAARHELKADPARQGRLSRPGGPQGFQDIALGGGVASLSRVAFSADGRLALAYVAHGQTSPGTSHFLLLRRTGENAGDGWVLCGAAQKDMLIF